MERPFTTDPHEHARYNARQAQQHAESARRRAVQMVPSTDRIEITPLGELMARLHRIATELEEDGPRSARRALQILEAVARFEALTEVDEAVRSDEF